MARYFLELAYKGTAYCGWQVQPGAPSVQEALQRALSVLLREPAAVVGAGRTDTGVHASFYVAHFDTAAPEKVEEAGFCYRLNSILPPDIAVGGARRVRDDAHARFDALEREYRYFLSARKSPFDYGTVCRWTFPTDTEAMNRAAALLVGRHDFRSFEKLHSDNKTSLCRVTHARWEREGERLVFTIRSDRFLRNMVRAVVGTLLDVGRGRLTVGDFEAVFRSGDRGRAGTSAPACGLFLTDVKYPADIYCSGEEVFGTKEG